MTTSLLAVAGIVVLCLGLAWLLPKTAPAEEWQGKTLGELSRSSGLKATRRRRRRLRIQN